MAKKQENQPQAPKEPYLYVGPTVYRESYYLIRNSVFKELPENLLPEDKEFFYPLSQYAKNKKQIDKEVAQKLKERGEKS